MSERRAHGIDISQHQGRFDPTPENLLDVDFIIMRISQSDDTLDLGFSSRNFFGSALRVPARGAYHFYRALRFRTSVLLPESSATKKILKGPKQMVVLPDGTKKEVPTGLIQVMDKQGPNWDAQANFFLRAVEGKEFHFFALDIETGRDPSVFIGHNQNIFTQADVQNIRRWIEFVNQRTGKPVLLYTNQNIYNTILLPNGGQALVDLNLWLAGYPPTFKRDEDQPLTIFPIRHPGVKNWHFWQYSADGNNQGQAFGAASRSIDLNVFNGPVEKLREFLGLEATGVLDKPGEPSHPAMAFNFSAGMGSIPALEAQDCLPVIVTSRKTTLQSFDSRDRAGKPIMKPHEPRVRLIKGSQLLVSATHKESAKDKGDGIIHGTGNIQYYFIPPDPSNGEASGLFVKAAHVRVLEPITV